MGGQERRANGASRAACRVRNRHGGGLAFLRALLHPTNSAPQLACRAVLRAALDRTDTVALLVVTTCSHLCLVGGYHCRLLYLALARGCTTGYRQRRDAICSSILLRTTGFSSGAINRNFISKHNDVLLVGTSYRFHSRAIFSANPQVSTLTPGLCRVRGRCLSKTLRNILQHTLSIFLLSPGALDPVRDFPILAKLLAERYQPVARTAEGVIYHRNDSPVVAHHSPKSNR